VLGNRSANSAALISEPLSVTSNKLTGVQSLPLDSTANAPPSAGSMAGLPSQSKSIDACVAIDGRLNAKLLQNQVDANDQFPAPPVLQREAAQLEAEPHIADLANSSFQLND
jgi:hypothetical protein